MKKSNHKLQTQIKVESNQNRINSKLNQLQIESTIGRINYKLNLSMVESTNSRIYCQLNLLPVAKVKDSQSQRSKIVKPSRIVGFGPSAIAPPVSARPGPIYGAGKLGRELGLASCELGAGTQAGSWKAVLRAR